MEGCRHSAQAVKSTQDLREIRLTLRLRKPILQSRTLAYGLTQLPVTRRDGLKILRSHTAASRVLVLLLLGFLIFETTVEAAHRHGRVLRSLPSSASSIGSPRSDNLAGGLLGCNDCVICQLQQSFSASLITNKTHSVPVCLRSEVSSLASVSVQSQILVPQCGRAPPFTL